MEMIPEFEARIGYVFRNKELLHRALVHSSFANENKEESNERLEFLGDSVLGFVTAEYFFKNCKTVAEGELTKKRAALVCEQTLFSFAKKIELGSFVLLGKGEEQTGGRKRASLLSDAIEAIIAAIYLDGGIEPAKRFVMDIINWGLPLSVKDYKTELQEIVQRNHGDRISYALVGESGPDHAKLFTMQVLINSTPIAESTGRSKKEAEQLAAKEALKLMGITSHE